MSVQDVIAKVRHALRLDRLPPMARKCVVTVVGGILMVAGLVMIFTPGPALLLIPAGLLLLASEFTWAERCADKAMRGLNHARRKWREYRRRKTRAA